MRIIKIIFIGLIFILLVNSCNKEQDYSTTTKATQSRYNTMNPSDYYKEMKSENLQYADIAWQAKNTYGWNCDEIVSLGENISTSGNELGDSYLKSQIKGYYQVATCSSGEKLRIYPRYSTYPIITNINGSFD